MPTYAGTLTEDHKLLGASKKMQMWKNPTPLFIPEQLIKSARSSWQVGLNKSHSNGELGRALISSLPASYPFYFKHQEVCLRLAHGSPQAVKTCTSAFPMSWHARMAPQWSLTGAGWYYMHKASHIVLNNLGFAHTAFMTDAFYVSDSTITAPPGTHICGSAS